MGMALVIKCVAQEVHYYTCMVTVLLIFYYTKFPINFMPGIMLVKITANYRIAGNF